MKKDLLAITDSFKQLIAEMEASWQAFVDESLKDFEATIVAEQETANAVIQTEFDAWTT